MSAQHPSAAAHRAGSRDPFFDNAKLLLVTLVVIGHSWTLLPAVSTSSPVYTFLYTWHVPAFVLVTGYLSRGFTLSRANLRRLLTTVAVPYFVFETLLALFRTVIGQEDLGSTLYLDPHWPLWYLSALFLWRLATPLLLRLGRPLPVAVAISLVGGLNTTEVLDVSRVMGLLPFFVAGLVMRREHFAVLARPRVRVIAAGLLVGAFAVATVVAGTFSKEWLYWRTGYADLGVPFWLGVLCRAGLLLLAATLALSALSLIATTDRWYTSLGTSSLVVYLFHGFVVKGAEYADIGARTEQDPVTGFLVVTGGAVLVSLLLSATPVARRLSRLVDPIATLSSVPDLGGPIAPHHHRDAAERRSVLVRHDHPRIR